MFDHYSKRELEFKLNCHPETLEKLMRLGPGFTAIKIQRGKQVGYVIRKDEVFRWMDAIRNNEKLFRQAAKHAPKLDFIAIGNDRRKYMQDMAALRRVQKVYQKRPYGRSIANDAERVSGAGEAHAE